MTKDHILNEIRRTAVANGGAPLGWRRFATETGIREPDWKAKLWARWSDAVREAGFAPNELAQAYKADELLEKYARLAIQLGRLPAVVDVRLAVRNGLDFPEWKTLTRQFGGKPQLLTKLREYCSAHAEYAAVAAMCQGEVAQGSIDAETPSANETFAFVYLAKSGRFYKIGLSNSTGRRQYELAIQMPEKVRLVHEIKTDDPAGIEEYWHKRFAAKRKNGEWFELDAKDVLAFKRRKFM